MRWRECDDVSKSAGDTKLQLPYQITHSVDTHIRDILSEADRWIMVELFWLKSQNVKPRDSIVSCRLHALNCVQWRARKVQLLQSQRNRATLLGTEKFVSVSFGSDKLCRLWSFMRYFFDYVSRRTESDLLSSIVFPHTKMGVQWCNRTQSIHYVGIGILNVKEKWTRRRKSKNAICQGYSETVYFDWRNSTQLYDKGTNS